MGKSSNPKISVVVPVHNGERTLTELFDSLNEQEFRDFEVVVVDDNSSDRSAEISKKYARVISNKKSMGPATARNIGIKETKGEILAFTDSDCVVPSDWLENINVNFQDKALEVIAGNVKIPKSTFLGDSISALGFPGGGAVGFDKMWQVREDGTTDHITSCNFAARRDVFKKHGAFDESFPLPGCEDPELSYRLFNLGVKIKYCSNVIVYHEARKELASFVRWQLVRGRGNYHFKRKIGKVGNFMKLRFWSSKNIVKAFYKDLKFPLIMALLSLSFVLQQYGYYIEARKYPKIFDERLKNKDK